MCSKRKSQVLLVNVSLRDKPTLSVVSSSLYAPSIKSEFSSNVGNVFFISQGGRSSFQCLRIDTESFYMNLFCKIGSVY